MALKTNCLTDGCVDHVEQVGGYFRARIVRKEAVRLLDIEVVVDIPSTLALTNEQAEEVENLLHNQVELVIAYALQKSRENKDA